MPRQELAISIPPGALGVSIKRCGVEGRCIVTGVSGKVKTDLEEGDIIQSLNGITLTAIEGAGVQVWVQLFKSMTTGERKLGVLRAGDRNGAARDSASTLAKPPAKLPAAGAALKDSTKHNASPVRDFSNKRQKVEGAGKSSGEAKDGKPSGVEVISLLEDSDDEEEPRQKSGGALAVARKPAAAMGKSEGANDTIELLDSDTEEDADPDVMEVAASAAASQWKQAVAAKSSLSNDSDEEELAIVGTKGSNALVDFPHARTNCVTYPFATSDKAKCCDNCYCYVCDIPASDCKEWTYHCVATHEDRRWREERERAKRRARNPAPAAQTSLAPAAGISAAVPFSLPAARASSRSNAQTSVELSVRRLLEKVTTVHPVEISPPVGSGFTTSLRHYQKQSLAFMVDTERTSSRGGWLADEVGMGKSAVVLALVASNPPKANTLSTKRQIERAIAQIEANDYKRGEIESAYSDEVFRLYGMQDGYESGSEEYNDIDSRVAEERSKKARRLSSEILPVGKMKVKTTVILTSASLLGQWEDECKKHAPGLRAKTFHSSRKKAEKLVLNRASIPSLNEIDVIISTSTFNWPNQITRFVEFHRVVQDESHLFGRGNSASVSRANEIVSPRRWGVTATPATSAARELSTQLDFIQGDRNGSLRLAITSFQSQPSEPRFNHLVDLLQTHMIRHTKSQRIGGLAALALPPSTTSTVMLTMSADEDRAFNCINGSSSTVTSHCTNGVKVFPAERIFLHQMSSVARRGGAKALVEINAGAKYQYKPERLTKVAALRKDLASLVNAGTETVRAVVFTQYFDVHQACVRGLRQDGYEVFEFSGGISANKKDEAIRSFQSTTSRKPAVFVSTIKSGNVGITLTAASRVYLMEPCLDPVVEVQAAGRIHRLGQNKRCHVVKYAFKKSVESNILRLHTEILAGRIAIVDGFVPPEAMRILAEGLPIRSG